MNISEVTQEQVDALKAGNNNNYLYWGELSMGIAGAIGIDCFEFCLPSGEWVNVLDYHSSFNELYKYRLRQDYQLPAPEPKAPEYEYCDIVVDNCERYRVGDMYLSQLTDMPSFAGCQFEGQADTSLWHFRTRRYICNDGHLFDTVNEDNIFGTATPIRARFVKEVE